MCLFSCFYVSGEEGSQRSEDIATKLNYTRQAWAIQIHVKKSEITGRNTFVCSACGKIYNARPMANKHRYVHTRRFACHVCDRRFMSQSILDYHVEIKHPGNRLRIWRCRNCFEEFRTKKSYIHHVRTHQAKRRRRDIEMYFKCKFCDKTFFSKGES